MKTSAFLDDVFNYQGNFKRISLSSLYVKPRRCIQIWPAMEQSFHPLVVSTGVALGLCSVTLLQICTSNIIQPIRYYLTIYCQKLLEHILSESQTWETNLKSVFQSICCGTITSSRRQFPWNSLKTFDATNPRWDTKEVPKTGRNLCLVGIISIVLTTETLLAFVSFVEFVTYKLRKLCIH